MGQPHSLLSFYPSLKDGEGTRDRSQKFNLLQCGTDREAYRDKKGLYMEGCGLPSQRSWVQLPPGALTSEQARPGSNLCRVAHRGLSPFGIWSVQRGFSPQAGNSHLSSPLFFFFKYLDTWAISQHSQAWKIHDTFSPTSEP